MVAIKFCECFCLLFVTVEEPQEPQYFISTSMSHAWRPPSHSFFWYMSHVVACHEVGSSDNVSFAKYIPH